LSHETVSRITDAVLEEVRAWQSRPLDPVYAAVFLDAIVVKVRDNQVVQNKPARNGNRPLATRDHMTTNRARHHFAEALSFTRPSTRNSFTCMYRQP
jgi:hypothetical protein